MESGREGGVLGGLFASLKFRRVALRVQVNISRFFRVAHQSTHPCNHAAVARAASFGVAHLGWLIWVAASNDGRGASVSRGVEISCDVMWLKPLSEL